MANKKGTGLIGVLANLFISYLKRTSDLVHLAGLEAKLAVKTLIQILVLLYLSTLLMLATWLSLLALLYFYLTTLNFTPLNAMGILTLLNIILILIIACTILIMKKHLFFSSNTQTTSIDGQ